MAIRLKIIEEYVYIGVDDYGSPEYGYVDSIVPIQEWELHPENINTTYTQGGNIPEIKLNIVFPELHLWKDRDYKNIFFEIEVSYQGEHSDWLGFSSPELKGQQFTKANLAKAIVDLNFKNLSFLPQKQHTAIIFIRAYERKGSEQIFIENATPIKVTLNVRGSASGSVQKFPTQNLTYNKEAHRFTQGNPVSFNTTEVFDRLTDGFGFDYKIEHSSGKSYITFSPLDKDTMKLWESKVYQVAYKVWNGSRFLGELPVILTVVEDGNAPPDFSVVPNDFSFTVSKSFNEKKAGTARLYNPQNLNISVKLSPSFIENARIENGELKFETKNSGDLALGEYSGEIILVAGSAERKVKVSLKIVRNLESDFQGANYFFALDKNKVSINRTNPGASYVVMTLEMYYKGFGKEYQEKQEYSQHYFDDNIIFYPGEEIQDFFIRCKDFETATAETYQYSLAVVNIIIREYNNEDMEISESRLDNIFFAPGRKPKCFPVFTDFPRRRTFSSSKIRLNTDFISDKKDLDILFGKYQKTPQWERKHEIHAIDFERDKFPKELEKLPIVTDNLQFIPFPNPPKIIHIFFENQNLVLDWFSCPGDYQRKSDFTQIIDENKGEKFGALETETLVLNTGWILREEVALISAIIKSRVCFILIDGEVIRARPMSKKNEIFDTAQNLYAMELEFNLKTNER